MRARLQGLLMGVALAASAQAPARTVENATITGTSAGPACVLIAVGVVRQTLRYPVLGGMGWGPGVPTVTKNVAELWLLDRRTNLLRLAASMPSPKKWTDATRYHLAPRVMADGSVSFTLHGCAKENPNCTDSESWRHADGAKPKRLAEPPPVTPEDSANWRACTTYMTYTEQNQPQVSIGPTGGPWQPVLEFRQGELQRVR